MGKLTPKQNNALHLYCDLLAKALNDSGYEMKHVLEIKEVDIPWTGTRVKEVLWRPIQEAMTGKESTQDLDPIEPSRVFDVLNRHISEKLGVSVQWPSEEELSHRCRT